MNDVESLLIIWKRFPNALIWYEEVTQGCWYINFNRTDNKQLGDFGND